MRNYILSSLFLMGSLPLFSQDMMVPQVPNHMQFADIELKITEAARREIQSDVDALTASAKYFQAKVDRAAMYMPFVEQVFKEEGLPDDFKYLAIQESGYIADAVSTSDAVGFWQFKKLTALEVGLRVDNEVDERLNIIASSRGAAKYLQKNNFYFNNWLYALQAYQMGPGGAMDELGEVRGGEKQLTIDKKTYWYIKKYLAHKVAFEEALSNARTAPPIQIYEQGGGQSLAEIAKSTGANIEELQEFNKWLLARKVPMDKTYAIIIPSSQAAMAMAAANPVKAAAAQPKDTETSELPVNRDIALSDDAFRHIELNDLPGVITNQEMSIDELADLLDFDPNKIIAYNDLLPHYHIIPGQIYYLKSKRSKARIFYHTVQEGESVWMIAQNYGMKQMKLMKMNSLESRDVVLDVGRILWLKKTRPANVPVAYWPGPDAGDN